MNERLAHTRRFRIKIRETSFSSHFFGCLKQELVNGSLFEPRFCGTELNNVEYERVGIYATPMR